jgi:hypothetical protein
MRILIVSVPHKEGDRYLWKVAYVLPFAPVGACNYGSNGDVVTLQLVVAKNPREAQAQEIFVNHVHKVAEGMHKNVQQVYVSQEQVVACGTPGLSLSWLTDHTKGGAAA